MTLLFAPWLGWSLLAAHAQEPAEVEPAPVEEGAAPPAEADAIPAEPEVPAPEKAASEATEAKSEPVEAGGEPSPERSDAPMSAPTPSDQTEGATETDAPAAGIGTPADGKGEEALIAPEPPGSSSAEGPAETPAVPQAAPAQPESPVGPTPSSVDIDISRFMPKAAGGGPSVRLGAFADVGMYFDDDFNDAEFRVGQLVVHTTAALLSLIHI